MLRRARSLSRLRGTTPGRETTPSIYDYGSGNDSSEGGGFSTRLNLYTSDIYGPVSRSVRAVSVARSKDIDDEILGPISKKITGSFSQYQRAQSTGRFDHLKARRPYSAYGTHDFDYFDRYTERIRDKTPIALDSHYTHYRPYYWYHTAPRTLYYSFPYDDWRYRPLNTTRSSYSSNYPSPLTNSSYNYRFNDSIDRVSSMKRAMRDLDYTRELRQLRFPTPSTYLSITQGDSVLNRARDEVRRTIDSRVGSSGLSRFNNPRDYFGRTFVQSERDDVTDVGAKYNNISRSVDFKPSTWKAEDNLETAYDLQAINDETLDKLYQNQSHIQKNRRSLLQENAGVAPRMLRFDMKTRQVRRDVDNALRLVRNLKELKNETFTRLKQPWVFGSYLS